MAIPDSHEPARDSVRRVRDRQKNAAVAEDFALKGGMEYYLRMLEVHR